MGMGDTAVTTHGDNSPAVYASSQGGGGGSAGTTLSVNDTVTVAITSTVGGSGGSGGRADTTQVCHGFGTGNGFCDESTVPKAGTITTYGDGSDGIDAFSIGGGGGHSGTTLSFSQGNFGNVDVTTGGSGGGGGNGEAVSVYSSGDIVTFGQQSTGLLAKSVGAGGGAAYLTASGSLMSLASISVTVGGKGGTAGDSGPVRVVSDGSISTAGPLADGIAALSVAKSGGIGGVTANVSGINTTAVTVGLGGDGGSGGTASTVSATWGGDSITTTGNQSNGIHAASQGGSGGRGGFDVVGQGGSVGSVVVAIGGNGGTGGTADDVTVTTTNEAAVITTAGHLSSGIAALSQGGHGGRGGATLTTTGASVGGLSVSIGEGGNGGGGGSSGSVTVNNVATIDTIGSQSIGLDALSLGGSGGSGGFVLEGALAVAPNYPAANVDVELGGSGGGGGTSADVAVTNAGSVTTNNLSSAGVSAVSMGGNGGNGGFVYTANMNVNTPNAGTGVFDIGGSGGGGGTGSAVTVDNSGTVSTTADNSAGIFALSSGGSGGYGGGSYSVLANINSQSKNSLTLTLNLGGSGGAGAVGGAVSVAHEGTVQTSGVNSVGIMAMSVGGNGGYGGNGGTIMVNASKVPANQTSGYNVTGQAAVGGTGGTGMNAGPAGITLTGADVTTLGATAHGLYAQSVGGGGGVGGTGSTYNLALSGKCSITGSGFYKTCRQASGGSSQTNYSLDINVGGSGGAGGLGGAAEIVLLDADVGTMGDASNDAFAQSIGGGGGSGGSGSTGISAFTTNGAANTIADIISNGTGDDPYTVIKSYGSWTVGVGGKGGAGGDGGTASVTGYGQFLTGGVASHGLFAQSVGGGGGSGGSAGSSLLYGVTVGGSGSGGGSGGAATVFTTGGTNIRTRGDGSYAILAQSVGGGGGETGLKKGGTILEATSEAIVQVGGSNGVSGDGGAVSVTNQDAGIFTEGLDSVGIFAQSIGGGGGLAPGGYGDGATGTVTVGGSGSKGNAGNVTVDHVGSIVTGSAQEASDNVAAHGVVAQSIGGGGGYAGAVVMGTATNFGKNSGIGPGGNTNGNGGEVSVNIDGPVTTTGGSSVGIFAQSVGGGGGVQGSTDSGSVAAADAVLIGTSGGTGTAGSVSVTYGGGALTTTGAGAHGIFAQSAGNSGSPSVASVTVTALGDVAATGAGSHGIFAQAEDGTPGPIEVTIGPDATVTGGGAATVAGAEDGAGVFVKGGNAESTITNQGAIASVLGPAGVAINVVDATVQIKNTGTITGQVLKASSIDFRNRPGGVVNAGPEMQVDRFSNQGLLTIGPGEINATNLSGRLLQGASGVSAFELDPSRPSKTVRADRLSVAGSASLAGRVRMNVLDPWQPEERRQAVDLIETGGALTTDGLAVVPSVVAQYRLRRPSSQSIGLSYDIDFRNPGILGSTNENQDQVAQHVHGTYRAQALDDGVALALIRIEERDDYERVMNTLGAEVALDNQIVSLLSGLRFGDALLSCAERTGTYRFFDDGRCGWLQLGGSRFERDSGDDTTGFDANVWQMAGGVQTDVDDWSLGAAISYETVDLGVTDSYTSSDGYILQAGASAKRRFGATELSASLAIGYGDFDIDRNPLPGISLGGHQRQWSASGLLRAAHLIERGGWSFRPRIDLGVDYLSMDGFDELDGPLGIEILGFLRHLRACPACDRHRNRARGRRRALSPKADAWCHAVPRKHYPLGRRTAGRLPVEGQLFHRDHGPRPDAP